MSNTYKDLFVNYAIIMVEERRQTPMYITSAGIGEAYDMGF